MPRARPKSIEECADWVAGGATGTTSLENADEARKIGDLYRSFREEDRIEELGHTPIVPLLEEVDGLRDLGDLARFLGSFERRGGGGLFGSYVNTDDRDSDRYVVNLLQGGIGLPDESYYREEKFAEIVGEDLDPGLIGALLRFQAHLGFHRR